MPRASFLLVACLLAIPAAAAPRSLGGVPFFLEPKAVVARVTPFANTAWFSFDIRFDGAYTTAELRPDTDGDGLVRMEYSTFPSSGFWIVVDMTAGTIASTDHQLQPYPPRPFPDKAFLRDTTGAYRYFVYPGTAPTYTMWVRPGVGAWRSSAFEDADRSSANDVFVRDTLQMIPLGGSPPPPANGVQPNDILLAMVNDPIEGVQWLGDRAASHLSESAGPGVISFPTDGRLLYRGAEEAGTVQVWLVRLEGTDGTVSVNYRTENGTALAGTHYVAKAGTVTFGPGEILQTIDIPLLSDERFSDRTQFTVVLDQPAGATIGGSATAAVEIRDADHPPILSIWDLTIDEGDGGQHHAPMTLRLSHPIPLPVTSTWRISTPNTSFTMEVVFAPGETEKTLLVPYEADTVDQPDRTFEVSLYSGPENAVVEDPSATLVIRDDDENPRVSVEDTFAAESAGKATVTVVLSKPTSIATSVAWTASNITASYNTDYTSNSGHVVIDAGKTTAEILVPLYRDSVAEGDESFRISLSDPQNLTIDRATATVVIFDGPPATSPALTVHDAAAVEDAGVVAFEIHLSAPQARPVSFRMATEQGTASANADFKPLSRIFTIPAGQSSTVATVAIVDDRAVEGDETLTVRISEAVNAFVAVATAQGTIVNDDVVPSRRRSARH